MPIMERTTVDIREEMALAALGGMFSVTEVADRYGVTRPTVRLWRERYRTLGRGGLNDDSHAPHGCPHQISEEIENLVVVERERFGWGSKKILRRLEDEHPEVELPSRSAVDAILRRRGMTAQRTRRRPRPRSPFLQRYTPSEPAELTTIDYKGQFSMGNGRYCFPLTMADSVSRYLLACHALSSTRLEEAWPVITGVFRKYGLPLAMQSDNGPPFGSPNGGLSTLSVRLMKLDILPVFSRPGRPQDNGKHERMHRDLKAETTRPPATDNAAQQRVFDAFQRRFNVDRPHESLQMRRPANVFQPSPRPYPQRIKRPEYPGHFEVRKVSSTGEIRLAGDNIFIGRALGGERIALEPIDDFLFVVHFYAFAIGKLDTASKTLI